MPETHKCAYYLYDAGGERFYKNAGSRTLVYQNGHSNVYREYEDPVLYASPYVVATPEGYTKHYFAESERIASRIGEGSFANVTTHSVPDSLLASKQSLTNNVAPDSVLPNKFSYLLNPQSNWSAHHTTYWQHADHLGSASYITDTNGVGYQQLMYMPWGEPLLDRHRSNYSYSTRYTFSGKERDEETGYSYFGARYYNSSLSIWLSVDPMSDKRSWISPYSYCQNRPITVTDPTGALYWIPPTDGSGNWVAENGDGYWRLSQQAGISLEDARNAVIAANRSRGQNRTSEIMVYPGDIVNININDSPNNNNNNNVTKNNFLLPFPANGRCESVPLIGTLIEELVRSPLQEGLESLGMNENTAYWVSTGITILPSLIFAKKAFIKRSGIKYPGNNPQKTPKGFEWRGKPGYPQGTKGSYYNPKTKESLHPDLDHPAPYGPHWDYIDPNGKKWRLFPDGTKGEK